MRIPVFLLLLTLIAAPLAGQDRFKKSDLSMTLRGIAAHDLPPDGLGPLITQGLGGSSDEREAALYAIAMRSGIMMKQTPENLAVWKTNRPTLQTFKAQVEQILVSDGEDFVREAAVMALAGLTMRFEKGEWVTDLSDHDVAFLTKAFHQEKFGGARTDILRLVVRCRRACASSHVEVRKNLVREAVYDATPAVVEQALYGAGYLKIADMLDFVASLLKDENPVTRGTAARAIGLFGRDGLMYRTALQDALSHEKQVEVRRMLEGAISEIVDTQ